MLLNQESFWLKIRGYGFEPRIRKGIVPREKEPSLNKNNVSSIMGMVPGELLKLKSMRLCFGRGYIYSR